MEPDASAPRVPRRAPPGAHAHLPERRATLAAAPSAAVPTDIRLSVRSWPSRLHSSTLPTVHEPCTSVVNAT